MIEGTEKLYLLVQEIEAIAKAIGMDPMVTLSKVDGLWKAALGKGEYPIQGDDMEDALMQLRGKLVQKVTPEHVAAMKTALAAVVAG